MGSVSTRETAPDSELALSPWCRNLCSSSHGGNPGLACAESGTNSTGSTGTRLTQTRELGLHLLAAKLRPSKANPPAPPTPPKGEPLGFVLARAPTPRFSGVGLRPTGDSAFLLSLTRDVQPGLVALLQVVGGASCCQGPGPFCLVPPRPCLGLSAWLRVAQPQGKEGGASVPGPSLGVGPN